MASLGPAGSLDTEPLIRTIKDGGLLNKTLMSICVAESMNKTGVKSELQNRIIETRNTPAAVVAPTGYPAAGSNFNNGFNMGGGANGYRGFGQLEILYGLLPGKAGSCHAISRTSQGRGHQIPRYRHRDNRIRVVIEMPSIDLVDIISASMEHLIYNFKNKLPLGFARSAVDRPRLTVWLWTKKILINTPDSADQVTVQPDGKWQLHSKNDNPSQSNGVASDDDDDDDLVEVTKNGDNVTMGTPQPYGSFQTPYNQRSVSTSSGMQGSFNLLSIMLTYAIKVMSTRNVLTN
ncbi:hypothetical protein M7I_2283 [Glarea lozoyensis 74030]|uniref:Uncharacterized protein n=1 Tax=Glarea lozoyensis (strain ATCC 74030 / MF5533) TaxID=1104152 RepID=H0EIC8_GLAL7|nr:hypothetical protein M7I_2283 [Glarea lozoyensis 74030]